MTDNNETNDATRIVVSIGSNLPDALQRVAKAIEWLSEKFSDFKASALYTTSPISGKGPDYANAVAMGTTSLAPEVVTEAFKDYERSEGRDEAARLSGMVPIDLDLVYYGYSCLRTGDASREYFLKGARALGLLPTITSSSK